MLGKTNSVMTVGGGSGGGVQANLVYAVNRLGTTVDGVKVALNKNATVAGSQALDVTAGYGKNILFGDDYLINATPNTGNAIYKINTDLSVTQLITISGVPNKPITRYSLDYYLNSTSSNFAVYSAVTNTLTALPHSYNVALGIHNTPYIVSKNANTYYIDEITGHSDGSPVLTTTASFTGPNTSGNPLFYYDGYYYAYYNNKYYAYAVDFDTQTATLSNSDDIDVRVGNTQSLETYQVSENSFLMLNKQENGFVKCTCEAGTITTTPVNLNGYDDILLSKPYSTTYNQAIYNPDTKTFTCIREKVLHILQYDELNNSIEAVRVIDLSEQLADVTATGTYFQYSNLSDLNYMAVSYRPGTSGTTYNVILFSLDNDSGEYVADVPSYYNMGTSTLTGFTTGNVDSDGKIEVKTVLPTE